MAAPMSLPDERGLLAAVVDSSNDAIITKTLAGTVTSWNAAANRLLGYTAEEILGQSVTVLFPPDRLVEETNILARLRAGLRIEHFETVRKTKSGRLIDVSLTISPLYDQEGTIVGASKIMRDITHAKAIESTGRALASNLNLPELLQQITDSATKLSGAEFGAFFYNSTDASGKAYQLITLSGAPMEAFERLGRPRATPIFAPTFDGGPIVRVDDVLVDPRYGQVGPHYGMPPGHLPVRSYLAVSVKSRNGAVIGGLFFGHSQPAQFDDRAEQGVGSLAAYASIAIDNARLFEEREQLVKREQAARKEAEHLNATKDDFLALLSHELRTPLNSILGWTQILRQGTADDADKGLEIIERNVAAQTRLIDDLLDVSRIVTGRMRLDIQNVMPAPLIETVVESLKPNAISKGIRIHVVLDPKAGPVSGDPNRLQQVVWNLLINAIKFTPKDGRIQVSLERVNSHLELSVADTGIGISEDLLPYVFDRFRQADSSRARRHGGLGIGLAIVKHIVELHGGQVYVKSPGEGQGATFRVNLPVTIASGRTSIDRHPVADVAAVEPEVSLDGLAVLIVDDEPDARELIKRILEEAGAKVLIADGGTDALSLLESAYVNLIVSDIGMPEMDGYQFLKLTREMERGHGRRTPAIALTAFASSDDRTRALLQGYAYHLAKPVKRAELLAAVAAVVGRT